MTPDVVVDVGNSRIKWGRVADRRVAEMVSLAHDDAVVWKRQAADWGLPPTARWAMAGVNPPAMWRLHEWLTAHGWICRTVTSPELAARVAGFRTSVEEPDKIGADRLLGALAAGRRKPAGASAVVIQVGTAMTIDFVRPSGRHVGGAILPGPRLMARSLHQHTAKLPLVDIQPAVPADVWGENTAAAIRLGIANAVLGAADQMVWDWAAQYDQPPAVLVAGGDAGFFHKFLFTADVSVQVEPCLVLDGLRLAAEALP